MTKYILALTLIISFYVTPNAQVQIYDAQLNAHTDCKTINSYMEKLGCEFTYNDYQVGSESVVELYVEGTGELAGIVMDTTKIKLTDLQYFKQDKRMNLLLSKYGSPYAAWIYKGQAYIGMSTEAAIDSWGRPKDINRTTTASGTKEQWVYDNGNYLYFEDGVLTTIQN